jgi:hypothetical protein
MTHAIASPTARKAGIPRWSNEPPHPESPRIWLSVIRATMPVRATLAGFASANHCV